MTQTTNAVRTTPNAGPQPLLHGAGQQPPTSSTFQSGSNKNVQSCTQALFNAFDQLTLPTQEQSKGASVSSGAYCATDFITDYSFSIRGILENFNFFQASPVDSIMGITTGMHSFLGMIAAVKAGRRALQAEQLGYKAGALMGRVDMLRGAVQSIGGTVFCGVRGLTVASLIQGVNTSSIQAPTLLGRVTFAVSFAGSIAWGVFFTVLTVIFSLNVYFGRKFEKKFDESIDVEKILQNPASLTEEELLKYVQYIEKCTMKGPADEIRQKIEAKYTREELIEEAVSTGGALIHQLLEEANAHPGASRVDVNKEQCKELVRAIFQENIGQEANLDDVLYELGMMLNVTKLQMKAELKLETMTSGACAKEMKKAGRLLEGHEEALSVRMQSSDNGVKKAALAEARALIVNTRECVLKMKETLGQNEKMNWGYVFIMSMAVLATVGGIILTGGVAALVIGIVMAVVAVGMTALDGYNFVRLLETGTMGKFDEIIFVVSSVLAVLAMGAGVTVVSVFSFGTLPLVALVIIGVGWLAINGAVVAKMISNEHRAKAEHPTPEAFLEALKQEEAGQLESKVLEELSEMFNKLLNADQVGIMNECQPDGLRGFASYKAGLAKAVQSYLEKQAIAKEHAAREKEHFNASLQAFAREYFTRPQTA